jgi:soluble lytic murein transglycosylase
MLPVKEHVALSLKIRPLFALTGVVLTVTGFTLAQAQSYPLSSDYSPGNGYATDSEQSDSQTLTAALNAAKAGDAARARAYMAILSDPAARKLVLWAMIEDEPDALTFAEADAARRELAGWPHEQHRQIAAEKQLAGAGLSPHDIIAWFAGQQPLTTQGALALASAMNASGQVAPATDVIREAWRTLPCDQNAQAAVLARFGAVLTANDHAARVDMLLYGSQAGAVQDLIPLLSQDQQALALARIAVRRGDPNAQALVDALPADLQNAPGLAYERVLSLRDRGETEAALALTGFLAQSMPQDAAERLWKHDNLANAALRAGNFRAAYTASAHSGLTSGSDAAEAEFEAGWLALTKLGDPKLADEHFERLQAVGPTTLTQSRAFFWRARAAEAMGDPVAAQIFYSQAAHFQTAFYGQLAAAKVGLTMINLGHDPVVTPTDLVQFETRDYIQAARLLSQIGARDTYHAFVAGLSEALTSGTDEAMLVDFTRGQGDQELSMRVVRNAAKRGFILPDRGYPVHAPPQGYEGPETAFVLGITRQESSFDPKARSGAGARGMMQLMPATAQIIARRAGLGAGDLDDPDYNMRVGATFLSQLVDQFGGSYLMAAAAYNAGPGRPAQWAAECGDPRSSSSDPIDFIECIPFGETRDYVMRVMEATQVYRARLNGGAAPNTLASDLRRGSYGYAAYGPAAGVAR